MRQYQTRHDATPLDLDRLDFEKGGGLVTVVAQDAISGMVLMVAHADREALERTLATGEMHYRSRTRGLWHKGATSGHVQQVISLHNDCDGDAVLALVRADAPACHTGASSCFSGALPAAGGFAALDGIIAERARAMADSGPSSSTTPSYTQQLLADRNLRLKKLGEEATELALACADKDGARAAAEAADLFYHALVALHALGVGLDDVAAVLSRRRG